MMGGVRMVLCLCCTLCCGLWAVERDYLAEAEAAAAAGEAATARRLVHFAIAAGSQERQRMTRIEAALAERATTGGDEPVQAEAARALLDHAPEDPVLRRLARRWRPPWAVVSGVDAHGPWFGLAAGVRVLRFRAIPPGHLRLGDGRELVLSRTLFVAEVPCTVGQWRGLVADAQPLAGDRMVPMQGLSAPALAASVVALDARIPAARVRLPTAVEWEYAARAGWTEAFLPGVETREDAVFERLSPKPVGRHGANAWGLFEVHGGAWELCQDVAHDRLVRRGGSWRSHLRDCALDRVVPVMHDEADPTLGVRLVIAP